MIKSLVELHQAHRIVNLPADVYSINTKVVPDVGLRLTEKLGRVANSHLPESFYCYCLPIRRTKELYLTQLVWVSFAIVIKEQYDPVLSNSLIDFFKTGEKVYVKILNVTTKFTFVREKQRSKNSWVEPTPSLWARLDLQAINLCPMALAM